LYKNQNHNTIYNSKKEKIMGKVAENLTGQKFGKLTAIEYLGVLPSGKVRVSMYRCKCECGKETIVRGSNLKNGNRPGKRGTKSCGCYVNPRTNTDGKNNIAGQRFGKLIAVKLSEHRNYIPYWECCCICGVVCCVSIYSLTSGNTKSCGCGRGRFIHGEFTKGKASYAKFLRKNPEIRLRNNVSTSIRMALKFHKASKNRMSILKYLPYTINDLKKHLESQFESWMNWGNFGGRSYEKRKTWWIDHIVPQSNFHFTSMDSPEFIKCWELKNLQPLEKLENIKKGNKII
jgi:hypothetical protein